MQKGSKKGAPIMARGGDQHQSIQLRDPRLPKEILERDLALWLAQRPDNLDIAGLTRWGEQVREIRYELFLWEVKNGHK